MPSGWMSAAAAVGWKPSGCCAAAAAARLAPLPQPLARRDVSADSVGAALLGAVRSADLIAKAELP